MNVSFELDTYYSKKVESDIIEILCFIFSDFGLNALTKTYNISLVLVYSLLEQKSILHNIHLKSRFMFKIEHKLYILAYEKQ